MKISENIKATKGGSIPLGGLVVAADPAADWAEVADIEVDEAAWPDAGNEDCCEAAEVALCWPAEMMLVLFACTEPISVTIGKAAGIVELNGGKRATRVEFRAVDAEVLMSVLIEVAAKVIECCAASVASLVRLAATSKPGETCVEVAEESAAEVGDAPVAAGEEELSVLSDTSAADVALAMRGAPVEGTLTLSTIAAIEVIPVATGLVADGVPVKGITVVLSEIVAPTG